MNNTTLVYIIRDDRVLLLCRDRKENDENAGKWIGVGGHFEEGESPEDCMKREMLEETGLKALSWKYRAVVTFVSDRYGTEYMHLFTVSDFEDTRGNKREPDCDEGTLRWVPVEDMLKLPHWPGDELFLKRIFEDNAPFFSLKLTYRGDDLEAFEFDGVREA
ncbi:MAG: 8-oxo-dGTP diphosphatase [Lachnospiraceae bacterium]|nr:8-oxo-dGTP diphosphatase [Lachnospiraceae bacterium]